MNVRKLIAYAKNVNKNSQPHKILFSFMVLKRRINASINTRYPFSPFRLKLTFRADAQLSRKRINKRARNSKYKMNFDGRQKNSTERKKIS